MKIPKQPKRGDVYSVWKYAHHKEQLEALKRGELIPPSHIQVDINGKCNHNCDICFYRNAGFTHMEFVPNEEIPIDVGVKIFDQMADLGIPATELSVRGDEIIPIEIGNDIQLIKIEDFVNKHLKEEGRIKINDNIRSWSLDDTLVKDRITEVFRHKAKEDLIKITLETGRNITVTKSHSIFFYEGGKITAKKADDIKINDLVVLSKARMKNNNSSIKIKLADFDNTRGATPDEIIIEKNMCRLLGYFVAEGSYQYCRGIIHGICFTFGNYEDEKEYIEDIINILNNLNIKHSVYKFENKNKTQILVQKKWVGELLKHIDCGELAKRVPNIILNLDNDCKIEFLKGLYAGDGNFRSDIYKGCNRNTLHLKTASKTLQRTVSYLLDSLNIFHTVSEGRNNKRFIEGRELPETDYYVVSINNKDDLIKINDVVKFLGAELKYKDSKYSITGRRTKIIEINEDAYALQVKKIETIENTEEMVYDISVGTTHRFECSYRIICHNTGGGEPLLYPGIKQCLDSISKNDIELGLVTNGSLLTKDILDRITNPKWIRFSMDSATPQVRAKTHGCTINDFDTTVKNLRAVVDKFSGNKDARIGVSFVVRPSNIKDIVLAAALYKDIGVDNIRYSFAFTSKLEKILSDEQRTKVFSMLADAKKFEDKNYDVFIMDKRMDDFADVKKDFSYCGYQMFTFQIGCDSLVYPCCVMKYHKLHAFGDIRKESLKDIIYGEKRRKYIENFDVDRCLPCWISRHNIFAEYLLAEKPPHVNFT